jgi:hypothetical protein
MDIFNDVLICQNLPFVLQPPCLISAESIRNINSPVTVGSTLYMDVILTISDVLDAGNEK